MQWSLFLLILMGQCSFFTCHLYKYHFIREKMTWQGAQAYCREKHTDLATVFDMTDMRRLHTIANNQDIVWIGLYNETDGTDNRKWHWSLPGVEFNENKTIWYKGEPNDKQSPENCVQMKDNKWQDHPCDTDSTFMCYQEHPQSHKIFRWINESKTWLQAQNYCRQHHTDLISGFDQFEEQNRTTEANTEWTWIGLFRDSWKWSDNSSFSFRHWDESTYTKLGKDPSKMLCAASILNIAGRWSFGNCTKNNSFFCYDDKVILIKQKKTWEKALYFCRENYKDLVSITNLAEQRWVQERAKNADTDFVWLGLRYTCTLEFWFWVSDERVSYTNWASDGWMDDCDMSGAMERGGEHEWFSKLDNKEFNFICSKF